MHAGNFATKLLTRSSRGIMKPQVHELGGRWVRVYPLCHPAAALRTPATLEALRDDFRGLPTLLEEPAPLPPGVTLRARAGAGAADGPVRLVACDNRFVPAAMRVAPGTTLPT